MLTREKSRARQATVIDAYRQHSGLRSIPHNRHYVTLAGLQSFEDDREALSPHSEYAQVTSAGLVPLPKRQYVAFDTQAELIAVNKRVAPTATWLCEDIYAGLVRLHAEKKINPAIVFYDSMRLPQLGTVEASKLMVFLSKFRPIMFVANFIVHRQFVPSPLSNEEIFRSFARLPAYGLALRRGWSTDRRVYRYKGDHATMATVVFWLDRQ